MVFLTRRRQIAATVESTPGTAETLTAGNNIPRVSNIKWTPNILSVERPLNRNSLTPFPNLVPGQTTGQLTFDVECAGNSSMASGGGAFNGPRFEPLLRGCGLEAVAVKQLTIGAVTSGPFRHGETVTQAVSSATGAVVGDVYTGTTRIYLKVLSGTFNGTDLLTGGTSGATATPTAVSSDTYKGYQLQSDPDSMEPITIAAYLDGKIIKLEGAMGSPEFTFQHGNPVVMSFTFDGVHTSYVDGGLLTGASLQEGQYQPKPFFSAATTLSVTDGTNNYGTGVSGAAGPLNNMTLALGNDVMLRENSLAAAGGLDYAVITDRSPTGSFNPDELLSATYDWLSSFTGGTTNRMRIVHGTVTGNTFEFIAPGLVFSGMADGNREGIFIFDASFALSGGNYGTLPTETPGTDNEFVLIYR